MIARLKLPNNIDLPQNVAQRLDALPAINVYRMIANAPSCLIPWTDMVKGLYESKVEIRYREIAILRQAFIAKSDYELHQHRFIAQSNGISEEEIKTICSTGKVTGLSEIENVICDMAEQLESTAQLSDETANALKSHFSEQEVAELIILTSFYCCVARVLNATKVEIESSNPLAGQESPN